MERATELVDPREDDTHTGFSPYLVPLDQVADRMVAGSKAANLAELRRAGFAVPEGFVVTVDAFARFLTIHGLDGTASSADVMAAPLPAEWAADLHAAARSLGEGPFAVRSSGVDEDLPDASFAGQYETVLGVDTDDLERAVKTCWASAFSERVATYRRGRSRSGPPRMAVLLQQLVPAVAAGVAFTANPVTGERGEVVISAIRGLGERLVSGEAEAEEWIVHHREARCRYGRAAVLRPAQAQAVAEVARRIEAHVGSPQDVEWAIVGGAVYVLQARPITALDEAVQWKAPLPGCWLRTIRLGEWLPEPMTPLFGTWVVPRIEERYAELVARNFGVRFQPPLHVTVNGWYFTSLFGSGSVLGMLKDVLLHPRYLRILWAFARGQSRPELAEKVVIGPAVRAWRDDLLPRYRSLVASWEARVATGSPKELTRLIDEVAGIAGDYFASIGQVAGFAWKSEIALASFYRKHLLAAVRRSPQHLVRGLGAPSPARVPHAVHSADWVHPTLGELPDTGIGGEAEVRRRQMEAERRAAEAACRAALADRPQLLARFDTLLEIAQRYAVLREEQVRDFTLGWPLLRHAVVRLGHELCRAGVLGRADEVFFLTRAEVAAGLAGQGDAARDVVHQRRVTWERQRRLSPPLYVGKLGRFNERWFVGVAELVRLPAAAHSGALVGMPASPGRASGPVRIVWGPDDLAHLECGEVLVAQATAPAWTRVFDRAIAVVTDGGTIAAHASLVAREYGIPAVVGVGDATARLRNGQVVTVDGSAGVVEVRP